LFEIDNILPVLNSSTRYTAYN